MILHVTENPISTNGLTYATVKDTVLNKNIIPPKCNCKLAADRNEEVDKIMADQERNKNGVCRHLMRLNEEWDNMVMDGTSYLTKTNVEASLFTAGIEDALGNIGSGEEVEGITMTSMLFCKHGGLITPIDSGQSNFYISMEIALQYMELYLEGNLSEQEALLYIQFVARNCGLKIATIGSGGLKGKDVERNFDDYIIAWCYYWNLKIDEGMFGNNKIPVRPDVVKAMIMDESEWGNQGRKNTERDVMQCFVPGDYALWILSGYNPVEIMENGKNRYHDGQNEKVVWVKDGTDYEQGSMRTKDYTYYVDINNTITITNEAGFGEGLGILRDNVVTIIDSSNVKLKDFAGEYLIHYDKETVNMSIACGIAYLAYHMEEAGSEKGGVAGYNGGGKEKVTGVKDAYINDINDNLAFLQHEDYTVEPLKE